MNENDQSQLYDFLADDALGHLDAEDRARLDGLRSGGESDVDETLGRLIVALDSADPARDAEVPPPLLTQKLVATGRGVVGGRPLPPTEAATRKQVTWLPLAAGVLVAIGAGVVALQVTADRNASLARARDQLASLESAIRENEALVDAARREADSLADQLASVESEASVALAQAAARQTDLAERLAAVTADLRGAELVIARYEAPMDPAELDGNRRKLLEVPGTVRLAWQPFDLPDNEAEQRGVQGDVVWNDDLEQGYLRFVGLRPNDPTLEQYQVWVIDDRGLEQKVSGGVFNASADGEVIVPIDPAIDVGRVALFAITIEKPGGTWVPDLSRRVVVAPRDG